MMVVDMTGRTFGLLTGVRRVDPPARFMSAQYRQCAWWEFSCACGKDSVIRTGRNVRRGAIKSCGCLNKKKSVRQLYDEHPFVPLHA